MKKFLLTLIFLFSCAVVSHAQSTPEDLTSYVTGKVRLDIRELGFPMIGTPTVGIHPNMDSAKTHAETKLQEQLGLSKFDFDLLFLQREYRATFVDDKPIWYVGVGAYRRW